MDAKTRDAVIRELSDDTVARVKALPNTATVTETTTSNANEQMENLKREMEARFDGKLQALIKAIQTTPETETPEEPTSEAVIIIQKAIDAGDVVPSAIRCPNPDCNEIFEFDRAGLDFVSSLRKEIKEIKEGQLAIAKALEYRFEEFENTQLGYALKLETLAKSLNLGGTVTTETMQRYGTVPESISGKLIQMSGIGRKNEGNGKLSPADVNRLAALDVDTACSILGKAIQIAKESDNKEMANLNTGLVENIYLEASRTNNISLLEAIPDKERKVLLAGGN